MITFIQKKNKGLTYTAFDPILDKHVDYWKSIKTVKVLKDKIFIQNISFQYFTELIHKDKIKFRIITEL
jgi:hypothetical protein